MNTFQISRETIGYFCGFIDFFGKGTPGRGHTEGSPSCAYNYERSAKINGGVVQTDKGDLTGRHARHFQIPLKLRVFRISIQIAYGEKVPCAAPLFELIDEQSLPISDSCFWVYFFAFCMFQTPYQKDRWSSNWL